MAGRIGQRCDEDSAAFCLEDLQKWPLLTAQPPAGQGRPRRLFFLSPPGNYTSRVWEYSSTIQSSDDMPAVQAGSSSFSLKVSSPSSDPCLLGAL